MSSANDGSDNENYPRFTDYLAGDFSIAESSALVDVGDNGVTGVTGPDFLGNQRIVNNVIDMGAIEYQADLSVDDIDAASFVIYPNPFDNQVVIKRDGALTVEVYNCLGQKIAATEAQDEMILNTSDWDGGVYLVKVNGKTVKVLK